VDLTGGPPQTLPQGMGMPPAMMAMPQGMGMPQGMMALPQALPGAGGMGMPQGMTMPQAMGMPAMMGQPQAIQAPAGMQKRSFANKPFTNTAVLKIQMEQICQQHKIQLTREALQLMQHALEDRTRHIISSLVHLSAQRRDEKRDTQYYEISANPKKLVKELQLKEKQESQRREEAEHTTQRIQGGAVPKSRARLDADAANDVAMNQIGDRRAPQQNQHQMALTGLFNSLKSKLEAGALRTPQEQNTFLQLNNWLRDTQQGKQTPIPPIVQGAIQDYIAQQQTVNRPFPSAPVPQTVPVQTPSSAPAPTTITIPTPSSGARLAPKINPPVPSALDGERKIIKKDFMTFALQDPSLKNNPFFYRVLSGEKPKPHHTEV